MPFIPYGRQNIDAQDIAAVVRALRSPWITQGPAIAAFERRLCAVTGAKYAVAVANGTVALHLAYLAVGIKAGDEVIMPANTFAATANAARYIGAKPVFADIELETNNLDPDDVARKVTNRTTAIVPVHFAGHPVEMGRILSIARRHRLRVVEDAAHALGASYRGRTVGSLRSDAVTLSFHPVKSITTGEGGAVMTNSLAFYKRLKLLRSHGVTKDERGWNVMTELGFNYRITDFQAALGTSQLRKLARFVRQRHQVVRWYARHLKGIEQLILPTERPGVVSAWHLYIIRTKRAADRDRLYRYLHKHGIGANFHYPPVYWHPYYRRHGYRRTRLANTDLYGRTAITLPLHTKMTERQVAYIATRIRDYFRT